MAEGTIKKINIPVMNYARGVGGTSIQDLVTNMMNLMTEDGIYIFSSSLTNYASGITAICCRYIYDVPSNNIGKAGTIYAATGAVWTFVARSNGGVSIKRVTTTDP